MSTIAFFALHRPFRSPSQRYRFDQFMPFLEKSGWEVYYSELINERDDTFFYAKGNYLQKLGILSKSVWKRLRELRNAKDWSVAFVQREAFMLGTGWFEQQIYKRTPTIFDFDDAIWKQVVSENNKGLGFLKNADKTRSLIQSAHTVWAGNAYLADYARQFNPNTQIVPTCVDTDEYTADPTLIKGFETTKKGRVCIGWSGSFSTIPHFEHALPALQIIQQKYPEKVYFKLIGDANYHCPSLNLSGIAWTRASELKELSEIDIGIMPLPDDEWTKGKCGLKSLVYMSMQIPTVLAPVGVNSEIVQAEQNGLFASSTDEWVAQLSRLIENPDLRTQIGQAGRERVVNAFSVEAWQGYYRDTFENMRLQK